MKCLTIFVLIIMLSQLFLGIYAKKTNKSAKSHKSQTKARSQLTSMSNTRCELTSTSGPLPKKWETAANSKVTYQVNTKYSKYNKKLHSTHKYRETTNHLTSQY
jgi:hypothetical protein